MKCSDVERVLPELLDGTPDSAFQSAFEIHLKSCADCSDLVSDLKLISKAARDMTETEEPAPRVWLRIAAELRAEGMIREPALAPTRPSAATRRRWSPLWLAPVAAALLAASAYVLNRGVPPQVAQQAVATSTPAASPSSSPSSPQTSPTATHQTPRQTAQPAQQVARSKEPSRIVEPESSADSVADSSVDDQRFLSAVSTRAPSMRATYEKQLQAVNAEIREVQAYLAQNPGDEDARQHLMDAYGQKALLYQIALDRIQ
jgi:Putative zinc-finger